MLMMETGRGWEGGREENYIKTKPKTLFSKRLSGIAEACLMDSISPKEAFIKHKVIQFHLRLCIYGPFVLPKSSTANAHQASLTVQIKRGATKDVHTQPQANLCDKHCT